MAITWKEFHGKKIMYVDYRDRKTEQEMLQLLEEEGRWLKTSATTVLVLSDYTGTTISADYMTRVKQLGKELGGKIQKSAVIGVTGLKIVLLQGYLAFTGDQHTKAFSTESEAIDWLNQKNSQ